MITLVFVMMIVERKREFGTLIALGAHKGLISRVVALEAVTVNAAGAAVGVVVSGILIASFSGLVRQTIGVGFLVPSLPVIAGLALGALASDGSRRPRINVDSAARPAYGGRQRPTQGRRVTCSSKRPPSPRNFLAPARGRACHGSPSG